MIEFRHAGGMPNAMYKGDYLAMRYIAAAGVPWYMGSTTELGRQGDRETYQQITLTNNYYIGVYEFTQAQWQKFFALPSGSYDKGDYRPIAYAKAHCHFLLHTGDLIDFVSAANLGMVRRHLPKDCLGALGNHEYSHYGWLAKKAGTAGPGRAETRRMLSAAYPFRLPLAEKDVNGVTFVAIDDADGTVSAEQVAQFRRIAKRGRPIILCQHVPFYTPGICRAGKRWWKKGTDEANPELSLTDFKRQRSDPVTRDFIGYLKTEPLLKGVLSGHLHLAVEDRFSPTAMQYVAGPNFSFKAQMVRVV